MASNAMRANMECVTGGHDEWRVEREGRDSGNAVERDVVCTNLLRARTYVHPQSPSSSPAQVCFGATLKRAKVFHPNQKIFACTRRRHETRRALS